MKKWFMMTIAFIVLLFNVNVVYATQPSIIEYGLRVGFEDCENTDGYLVDLLFSKSEVDSNLYSNTLNPYYFSYEETIRNLALEDISQIEYLNYDTEFISYLAYFKNAKSNEYIDSCTLLFGENEQFKEDLGDFKVVILNETGEVIATSDIYTTDIVPDHVDTITGQMIVYNQSEQTFSLLDYQPIYEVYNAPSLGLLGLYGLLKFLLVIGLYVLIGLLILTVVFIELKVINRISKKKEYDKKIVRILALICFIFVFICFLIGIKYGYPSLAFIIIVLIQFSKLVYVFVKEKHMDLVTIVHTIISLLLLYVLFKLL